MNCLNTIGSGVHINGYVEPPPVVEPPPPVFNYTFSQTITFGGIMFGVCTANNGIGYISLSTSNIYKTTNSGSSWLLVTGGDGNRGIATNSANTRLIQGNATGVIGYSTNGGTNWSTGGGNSGTQACFISRSNSNNPIIYNRNGVSSLHGANSPYGTINTINAGDVVANVPSAACISDVPNFIYVNYSANASKVYRNSTNGNMFNATLTNMTTSISLGAEANNLYSSCCNANNTVNLIVGHPGTIYRSTSWNGTFTRIANSPYGYFRSISTSSAGNIVCAVMQSGIIYISNDKGLTFEIAAIPALQSGELLYWGSVSPDEKFILVTTYISTTSARAFVCVL
jgi:hypothetical protein